MPQRPKPLKPKTKLPVAPKSPKNDGSRVRDLENRLAEALKVKAEAQEQQTAISEILRAISSSPMDLQPVLDEVVRSAARFCGAPDASIFRLDGGNLRAEAHHGWVSQPMGFLVPLVRGTVAGRSVLERQAVGVTDLQGETEEYPEGSALARQSGLRATLSVPLLREGAPIGVIMLRRAEAVAFTDKQIALLKTFADQAVIAIENVRLFKELEARNRDLTTALDQQTATSDILKVIADSPTAVQPVFDAIVASATRLCEADLSGLYQFDGALIHFAAQHGRTPEEIEAARQAFPQPLGRASVSARAILDATVVQVPDVREDSEMAGALRALFRTVMAVPMLRDGRPIGTITVARRDVRLFSDEQIALLQTFADQAVIAIENVRLFNETKEALEQQTATSEILRVIATSPTDLQPVLDAVVVSAGRLCQAADTFLLLVEGDQLKTVAGHGSGYKGNPGLSYSINRGWLTGRAVVDMQVVHVEDLASAEAEFPLGAEIAVRFGHRTALALPLLRKGLAIGALFLRRQEVRQFSGKEIALLQTFADQAVIAIENVRLFKELQVRNHDLAEALTQQTATSEVLKVISRSTFDLQPVLQTLIENATRLCDAQQGFIYRSDGEIHQLAVDFNAPPAFTEWSQQRATRPGDGSVVGRVALEKRVVQILDAQADAEWRARTAHAPGISDVRTLLGVPMFRDGVVIGVFAMWRSEIRPFTDKQIDLVMTFADQAVIAIENVRLFTELQSSNRELTTALDTQTATSDILRVISRSQTDVQPVFDAIVDSAVRLCDARWGAVFRYDGALVHVAAHHNFSEGQQAAVALQYPMAPTPAHISGRAILTGATAQIPDIALDAQYGSALGTQYGYRSMLAVPILRAGAPIGVIVIYRKEPGPFADQHIDLLQSFADQAVIAIENVRLFTELQEKNRALTAAHTQVTEALEQQTATAEILRVISQSPTNVQPVFDAIVQSAVRLLGAYSSTMTRIGGDQIELVAITSTDDIGNAALRAAYPLSLYSEWTPAQAIRDRAPLNIADAHTDPRLPEAQRAAAHARGYRSQVVVPLLRHDEVIGAIGVTRREPGGFTDDEIALLQTFADQAVIAIENARLLTELQEKNRALTEAHAQVTETLDQQTATSQILSVISRSQTDERPVFDTIVESVVQLCDGVSATVYRFDGNLVHLVAHHHSVTSAAREVFERVYPLPPSRTSVVAQAILDRAVIHVRDFEDDPGIPSASREMARAVGHRSLVAVPMLRGEDPIGAISVGRRGPHGAVRPFSDSEITLLKTFADQAVIAIENVRLFNETKEALEQQTATSDILRVISSSPTDVQPVFDAIAESAARLCDGIFGMVYRLDGDTVHMVAHHNVSPEGWAAYQALYPRPLNRQTNSGRAMLDGRVAITEDVEADTERSAATRHAARLVGLRSAVTIPLLREERTIGALTVGRDEPGTFTPEQVALLRTFADQAVIAIENVRLFKELEARTQDLTRSVAELRALGEVGQAISSTLDLRTVLSTIVARATQLSSTDAGVVYEYDEQREVFVPRATEHLEADIVETMLTTPVRKGEGATGRLAEIQEPIQVPDILAAPAESRVRGALVRAGYRALLAVPLVRDDHLLGGLTVIRKATGAFAPEVIELLRTFATQSALAIQNARLFLEIEDKSRQLEVASQHKSEFLANMSHELRTPLNAIIGFSEVLTERMFGDLNEKQDEYLKDIYASGTHLLSLINDILDLSKIEAGRMELELTDFHLPTALDNALTLVRERAGRRSITLQMSADERLGEVRADERKIRQVVLNLLSNAIKFTSEGGRIEVGAVPRDGSVEVSVSDTGVGIAPEDQEAVFEEFRQVGAAEKKVEGTGLGLTLCRKFIELHGGRIWVKSQVDVGSTFTFTIPVRRGE